MFNKPSALITTKAKYWVFYDQKKFVIIEVRDIYNCLLQNQYKYVEFVGNGDTAKKKDISCKQRAII